MNLSGCRKRGTKIRLEASSGRIVGQVLEGRVGETEHKIVVNFYQTRRKGVEVVQVG